MREGGGKREWRERGRKEGEEGGGKREGMEESKRKRREGGRKEGRKRKSRCNLMIKLCTICFSSKMPLPLLFLLCHTSPSLHHTSPPLLPTTTPPVSIDLLLLDVCQQPHGPLLGPALVIHLPLLSNTLAADFTLLIEDGGGEQRRVEGREKGDSITCNSIYISAILEATFVVG